MQIIINSIKSINIKCTCVSPVESSEKIYLTMDPSACPDIIALPVAL